MFLAIFFFLHSRLCHHFYLQNIHKMSIMWRNYWLKRNLPYSSKFGLPFSSMTTRLLPIRKLHKNDDSSQTKKNIFQKILFCWLQIEDIQVIWHDHLKNFHFFLNTLSMCNMLKKKKYLLSVVSEIHIYNTRTHCYFLINCEILSLNWVIPLT